MRLSGLTPTSSFLHDDELVAPSTPMEVQLFVQFHSLVHYIPQVSNPLMIQSGWHSVKIKCWNPDCINFNCILLTGKAIWYPIVNISRKEFLSLRCCLSWISDIFFLGLWKVNRRLTNSLTFWGLLRTSWILIYHKMGDIKEEAECTGSTGLIFKSYVFNSLIFYVLVKVFIQNKIQLLFKLWSYSWSANIKNFVFLYFVPLLFRILLRLLIFFITFSIWFHDFFQKCHGENTEKGN